MKKTEWCRQNGVTVKQFYYWQKKIRVLALKEMSDGIGMDDAIRRDDPTAQLPSFVELKTPAQPHTSSYACRTEDSDDPQNATLTLRFKDYRLEIQGNSSESALRMVVLKGSRMLKVQTSSTFLHRGGADIFLDHVPINVRTS